MNISTKTLLHLLLIHRVTPRTVFKLLAYAVYQTIKKTVPSDFVAHLHVYGDLSLDFIYAFSISDFVERCGIKHEYASVLVDGLKNFDALHKELVLIEKHAVDVISLFDSRYPELLRHIHLPPYILYCKGAELASHAKRVSFVGARKSNEYGRKVINNLVSPLVEQGYEIVSGGALGADTFAHEAVLQAGGKTIVVLGSGLLKTYPPSNKKLFERIEYSGGTLVSPFPLTFPPDRTTFPARNRIIAGLSKGTLVVQAAARSGALITAEFALQQGKHVFAIPGSILEPLSFGCHALLNQGAKLVQTADDILQEFGDVLRQQNGVQTDFIQQDASHDTIDPLVQLLDQPASLDELSVKLGLDIDDVQDKLFNLQLEGAVRQTFSGLWERI